MKKTEFFNPRTFKETIDILDSYKDEVIIINGGTDIVEKINDRKVNSNVLVYIQNVSELREIREEDNYVIIGGAVTYTNILESALCKKLPALIDAVEQVGSPAIRNVGTLAGNIGTAAPAPDGCIALLALEAEVVLSSKEKERQLNLTDVFVDKYKTVINSNEIIKEIRIPLSKLNRQSAYKRMARRKAQDIGKILVGVSLEVEDGICTEIRIALGALNTTPFRVHSLESMLTGLDIEEGLNRLSGVFPVEAKPRESRFKAYKEVVTSVILKRAIRTAWERIPGGENNG